MPYFRSIHLFFTRLPGPLRNSLLGLATTLLGGMLGGIALFHYVHDLENQRAALVRENETAQARLAGTDDEERIFREDLAHYRKLLAQGRLEHESRQIWIKALAHIKDTRHLIGLKYEIGPQKPLDPSATGDGKFLFHVSPMQLDLPLLHEADLLTLLDDLADAVRARIRVNNCRIERLAAGASSDSVARLAASCQIDWVTVTEKS